MSTALVYGLDSFGRKDESDGFFELGYIDAFLLEVRILAHHTRWVKLGSTSSVGVASTDY